MTEARSGMSCVGPGVVWLVGSFCSGISMLLSNGSSYLFCLGFGFYILVSGIVHLWAWSPLRRPGPGSEGPRRGRGRVGRPQAG